MIRNGESENVGFGTSRVSEEVWARCGGVRARVRYEGHAFMGVHIYRESVPNLNTTILNTLILKKNVIILGT